MDCRRRGDVPLYFDGELDPAATREFERHLDGCSDCRDELVALDALRSDLRDSLSRVTAPVALRERLLAISASSRPTRRSWLPLAAAAALAFVVGGAATTAWHGRGRWSEGCENTGMPRRGSGGTRDAFQVKTGSIAASAAPTGAASRGEVRCLNPRPSALPSPCSTG